ncbi:MAG TPA: amidohydrolase, partial [Verrucomicrobiae bacterium]|nr:amidohydrolase [Verrucomicrobiae bacterium]
MKDAIAQAVDRLADELEALSKQIHANPELGYKEVKACAWLSEFLGKQGFKVEQGVGGVDTAFRATIETGDGPTVAILCEYDALPGIGHACGHNLMGTAALGAFLALRDLTRELPGRVRLLGCPAEERGNGKNHLIRAGLFADVDAALMYHPGDRDELDPLMLALVSLEVEFIGKAAHAAAEPQDGINALDALLLSWTALSALRLTVRSDSRFHGIITDG